MQNEEKKKETATIYENTHIFSRYGLAKGTITIHAENVPEQVMLEFQDQYRKFKTKFMQDRSKLFFPGQDQKKKDEEKELEKKPGIVSSPEKSAKKPPLQKTIEEGSGEKDAKPGNTLPNDGIIVGCKVVQAKGKSRAFGTGTVLECNDKTIRASFAGGIKVLPRDHFSLAIPNNPEKKQ